jgi:hypothetical protein
MANVLTAAAPVVVFQGRDCTRCAIFASAVLVPTPVPSRAGMRASRTVAADSADGAGSTHNTPAGRSSPQKNFVVMTLARSGAACFPGGFRFFSRSR